MSAKDNPTTRPPPSEPESLSSSFAFALAAHTSDFVGVFDEDGVARFINRSVRGADAGDVEGKPLEQFLSEERAQRIRAMVEEVRASGHPVIDDAVRIVALDGSERWFIEKCIPIREADGALRFMLVRTETTHLRRTEEELRASEARYRTLFESNPDPVVVVLVSTLGIVAANPAAVRLYGWSEQELRGLEWLELFHADEREALRATYLSNPSGERRNTARQLRRDGSVVVAEIVDNPIVFAGVAARMAVVRDATERLQVEVQLRHAQKMEAMGVFAGGIAHDFNNLLTVINGCADGVRDVVPSGTEASEDLDYLFDAVVRGTNLTKKLMLFCRRLVLDSTPVDMVQVIDDLGGILRRLLGQGPTLTVVHGAGSAFILGDRTELEQLVSNLVVNAGHATTATGHISIHTALVDIDASYTARFPRARPGRYVELNVEDDGHGMDEATLARVFEPFFTTKAEGTGLGLAVVHGVIERHDGFLKAESRPGAGTSIAVYLPLSTAAVAAPVHVAPVGVGRVLVADDEPVVRKITERMLRQLGYEVVGTGDGEEALQAFEKEPDAFDIVVLDVMMPKLKGSEALVRMRAIRPDIKVLFVSGHAGAASEMPTLRVLEKPFTTLQLEDAIRRLAVG
ncbi:MAG: sensor hybrid histidine kinase [Myxococcaceae bacterium]|nr:sensor hybrid histidine kinase [Myxococcaceae bacterium]